MSTTPTAEHIRAVFQRYCELVSRGDFEAIALLYAEDATVEDPIGSPPHCGRAAIREFYKGSAAGGGVRLELDGAVRVAGREAAAAMIARPAADRKTRVETLDAMVFDERGLITSMRAYWSADTIFRD